MQQRIRFILRLTIALAFGSIGIDIALSAGQNVAQHSILGRSQLITRHQLDGITKAIAAYRGQKHTLPRSLGQLKPFAGSYGLSFWADGMIHDGWGHPFAYTVTETSYQVISYGEDGKPGGVGWDTDLTSDNVNARLPEMTFHQFLTEPDTQGMVWTAIFSGLFAGILCFVAVRPETFTWQRAISATAQILVTLAIAAGAGAVITAAHVPSGH